MGIQIKNISTCMVSLQAPGVSFNRELAPGRTIPLTQEEYDELAYDVGFSALLNGHYIKLLGLEEEKQVEIVENIVEATEIEKMLVSGDVTKFAKFIPTASVAEKESAVKLAIDHKITNAGIVGLIKRYCDVDVINAIGMKHDAEEK